jgi:diguanylate cyclase (GGDEF)-like protein
MRRRIGIYGASDEALQLIPLLLANPDLEIAGVYDSDPAALRERLGGLDPGVAETLRGKLSADADALVRDPGLYAVIDSGQDEPFSSSFPETLERGVQVVTPLVARLLWCYGTPAAERKAELLQALHEVVESYNLTVEADELFRRMLEIAIGVTGADGGSVMLLDPEHRELRVRVAVGVEPELWPKIRVPIGEGIAGRVVEEARPLRLRGKADRRAFRIVRDRLDVESALCVPLIHGGRVLGVLNLHHGTRPDAFSEEDLEFTQQLGRLDAQIIARAQEHEVMRSQASRYAAVREVRELLAGKAPLRERLARLCRYVVSGSGLAIANLYLYDQDQGDLFLAGSSLEGSGFGEELRVSLGQGLDGGAAASREPVFLRRPDGALAYAALPLVAGDTLAGVLSIQTGAQAPRGRAAEETLQEVAAVAAEEIAALEREARLQNRATKMGAINEAGIRMVSETDPAEVLRLGASSAAMILEADHAILRVRDEQTGRFAIRSYFGSAEGRLQERVFRIDKRASVDTIKRRAPLLVRDVASDPVFAEFAGDLRSLLAAPLKHESVVVGTLALYDKMSPDRLSATSFTEEDRELFAKFVSHLERALSNAWFHDKARRFRNFDDDTGLPNATYLGKRIQEELTRSGGRPGALALAMCRIENLADIERARDKAFGRRVLKAIADALRAHLRDFDVAGRTGEAEFVVLLPEPGYSPSERVFGLARSVADDISKEDALNEPQRVALAFGYAVHPEEGTDLDALLERAREPRIRMV